MYKTNIKYKAKSEVMMHSALFFLGTDFLKVLLILGSFSTSVNWGDHITI